MQGQVSSYLSYGHQCQGNIWLTRFVQFSLQCRELLHGVVKELNKILSKPPTIPHVPIYQG